jgi:predicted RNase H-like HicB family nuclease
MNRVKAFIERGDDGTYGVYADLNDNTLNYGIHGDGKTVNQAIDDFKEGYLEMKELYKEEGMNFVEAEFEFHYDNSFLLQSCTQDDGTNKIKSFHHEISFA